MKELRRYEDYSRQDVHDIFSPETPFTPQAGTWGLHGYVPIPDRPGDFVFFVTYGQRQGNHVFEEGITRNGVLTWQSQPRHTITSPTIQQFIAHDELVNTIYLFLRTSRNRLYTYMGKLKYVTHDPARESPVWFQWQIVDWDFGQVPVKLMGLALTEDFNPEDGEPLPSHQRGTLIETEIPSRSLRAGTPTPTFQARKPADYAARDAANGQLGLAGEKLVIAYEKEALKKAGLPALAEAVRHVAATEGDGAGYDVLSWTQDGERKYIEVKTTQGGKDTAFYLSSNELAYSKCHPMNFFLYRVFGYDPQQDSGRFYVIKGSLEHALELAPTQYRARPFGVDSQ